MFVTSAIVAVAAAFAALHVWATRNFLSFMKDHPEVERQLIERVREHGY